MVPISRNYFFYRKRKPSHILIEATGVAEPKSILETIYSANLEKVRGTDFLRVANLITVVRLVGACGVFMRYLGKVDALKRKRWSILPFF